MEGIKLIHGGCLGQLQALPEGSVDSLITDPPAGISFMGKGWDGDKGGRAHWIAWMTGVMAQSYRVLKPGAHGFVWALPRTSHWTATALEDAGFEIRDIVTHIFGSGFPKNHDVSKALDKLAGAEREILGTKPAGSGPLKTGHVSSTGGGMSVGTERSPEIKVTVPATDAAKQWDGWGTALKPSNEHWILIRKPLGKGMTVARNVLKHGTGAINIDASRIEMAQSCKDEILAKANKNVGQANSFHGIESLQKISTKDKFANLPLDKGRFPANTIVDESAVEELDWQSGVLKQGGAQKGSPILNKETENKSMSGKNYARVGGSGHVNEPPGGASRFFYCPKAPKKDKGPDNTHPTVKNTKLMSYLLSLVTPPGGTVLDPFMGSGSTGVSAVREMFNFIGIEAESGYHEIARRRIHTERWLSTGSLI